MVQCTAKTVGVEREAVAYVHFVEVHGVSKYSRRVCSERGFNIMKVIKHIFDIFEFIVVYIVLMNCIRCISNR